MPARQLMTQSVTHQTQRTQPSSSALHSLPVQNNAAFEIQIWNLSTLIGFVLQVLPVRQGTPDIMELVTRKKGGSSAAAAALLTALSVADAH